MAKPASPLTVTSVTLFVNRSACIIASSATWKRRFEIMSEV
jgi:hypothetical protein